MKRKKLPSKKHKGIFIYCSKCKKYYSYTKKREEGKTVEPLCGESGKVYSKCKYPEKQKYKARVHVSGSINNTTSKVLNAKTYEEAVVQTVEFSNNFYSTILSSFYEEETKQSSKRIYLLEAQAAYIDFLADVDVPEHKKKHRSKDNIENHIRSLKYFNNTLKNKKVNIRLLPIDLIDDTHVGYFHTYLTKNLGNRSYNKYMDFLKHFFSWIISNHNLKLTNPFESIQRKSTTTDKKTITGKEFNALLGSIVPENGIYIYHTTNKKIKKNFYSPFLKDALLLGLHTGGRREEITGLKWNMIHEREGRPMFIEVVNLKVERKKKVENMGEVAPKIIPITSGLLDVLMDFGYEKKKGTNDFILKIDREKYSLNTILEKISKGFSHYYKQLNTGRDLQFKCLRKTYLTYLEHVAKGDTKSLSSHASDEVLQKHYIDERIVSKAIQEVRIFG